MPQTLREIRAMLEEANLRPQKMFGQNFLIDHNLLAQLVELAEVRPGHAVLEVGPGTGTLTELLLDAGAEVVAAEIDRGLAALLDRRFGDRANCRLMCVDVMAGKHALNPAVLEALRGLGRPANLVSNLPYNIATPLICECLLSSLASHRGQADAVRFERLTFTVQREVTQRLTAGAGQPQYGAVSVLTALLGEATLGRELPPQAFWPRPAVVSRMMRIDFRPPDPHVVPDIGRLRQVLTLAFSQRRKQIGSAGRRGDWAVGAEAFAAALAAAGIEPTSRPEEVSPQAFAALARELGRTES